MRQIQISLKNEQADEVLEIINSKLKIKHAILLRGKNNSLIVLRHKEIFIPKIIKELNEIGVGIDFGIVDILPLEATIPKFELTEDFEDSVEDKITDRIADRISTEEIMHNIEEGSKPSFNYFIFVILSAIMASVGLITNAPIVLIGSMILSPLLGPILGLSFGIMTKDRTMIKNSLIAQFFGILISIFCGIALGAIITLVAENPQVTYEMSVRTFPTYLDIIIAVCAGLAVGFCISGGIKSSMVGAAIALSLMPPAVNVGLALMHGDVNLALGSFVLLLVNVAIINVCTMLVLRVKKVHELPQITTFWKGPTEKVKRKRRLFRRIRRNG